MILGGGSAIGIAGFAALVLTGKAGLRRTTRNGPALQAHLRAMRMTWRMPPLQTLPPSRLSLGKRVWMGVMRAYLIGAALLVAVKVVQAAMSL